MLQKNVCASGLPLASQSDALVNPNWLAFFRRVRELAELARNREALAEHVAQVSSTADALPGRPSADAATTGAALTNKKAPADTGAYAKPQDCFSTTPKDSDYYEHTR